MEDCIFCTIAHGGIPARKIYEDEEMLAFHDADPQAPVHFLLVPKQHIPNIMEAKDPGLLGNLLYRAAALAAELGCAENGARFVVNCKSHGGQTVDHLHIHVLGGRPLGWPPG
jgi:histidine triad (HIT) family protein